MKNSKLILIKKLLNQLNKKFSTNKISKPSSSSKSSIILTGIRDALVKNKDLLNLPGSLILHQDMDQQFLSTDLMKMDSIFQAQESNG